MLWLSQAPAWCAFLTLCHLPFPSCQPLSPPHASLWSDLHAAHQQLCPGVTSHTHPSAVPEPASLPVTSSVVLCQPSQRQLPESPVCFHRLSTIPNGHPHPLGRFCPQGTCSRVWRHLLISQLGSSAKNHLAPSVSSAKVEERCFHLCEKTLVASWNLKEKVQTYPGFKWLQGASGLSRLLSSLCTLVVWCFQIVITHWAVVHFSKWIFINSNSYLDFFSDSVLKRMAWLTSS